MSVGPGGVNMSRWRDFPEIDHCLLLVCLTELLFSPIFFINSGPFFHVINFAVKSKSLNLTPKHYFMLLMIIKTHNECIAHRM